MSLLDTVRSAVKIADGITKPLQPTVKYYKAVVDTTGYGAYTHPSFVSLPAIVEWKQQQVRTREGILSTSRSKVMFLDLPKLFSVTGGNIGDHDKIVLPDGTTGPILALDGFMDAGNGQAIPTTVYIG